MPAAAGKHCRGTVSHRHGRTTRPPSQWHTLPVPLSPAAARNAGLPHPASDGAPRAAAWPSRRIPSHRPYQLPSLIPIRTISADITQIASVLDSMVVLDGPRSASATRDLAAAPTGGD